MPPVRGGEQAETESSLGLLVGKSVGEASKEHRAGL